MKKSLLRPFGWILPLAAVAAALLQAEQDALGAISVVFAVCMIGMLGLPEALRRAHARAVSRAKVAGLSLTAFLLEALIALGVFFAWRAEVLATEAAFSLAVGGMLVFLRTLQEHFAADDDRLSAVLIELLAAVAVLGLVWMHLSGNRCVVLAVVGAVCALGVLIALATLRRHGRAGDRVRIEPSVMKEIPLALLRVGLYPALCAGIWALEPSGASLAMFAAGALMVEAGRTAFRRDARETAGFSVSVTLLGVAASAAGFFVNLRLPAAALAALLALYAAMNVRTMLAFVLMAASAAVFALNFGFVTPLGAYLNPAGSVALSIFAALLMIPEWRELFRRARVKRIRKNAMKRAGRRADMMM